MEIINNYKYILNYNITMRNSLKLTTKETNKTSANKLNNSKN